MCQRLDQGLFIDDRAAGRVDQDGVRLHPGQLGRPDQVPCLLRQGHVKRQHVRCGQQGRQIHRLHLVGRFVFWLAGSAVVGNRHAEGLCPGGDGSADPAHADDPQLLAGQVGPDHQAKGGAELFLRSDQPVGFRDPARGRQQQRPGQFGCAVRHLVRQVGDHDPLTGCVFDVDVVAPRAVTADRAQPGRRVDQGLVQLAESPEHAVGVGHQRNGFVGCQAALVGVHDHLAARLEQVVDLALDTVGNKDLHGIILSAVRYEKRHGMHRHRLAGSRRPWPAVRFPGPG